MPTPRDLFLSPDLTEADAHAYLGSLGFRDAAAVDGHLQRMADDPVVRETLGRLAPDLIQALLETPDPDAAAGGLSTYVAGRTGRAMFLDYLREDPRALHVLTYVMGSSVALGDILIRSPEYFHWLVAQVERSAPDRQDHEEELASALGSVEEPEDAFDVLRRWKRRETLRIGTLELLRRETVHGIAAQLSDLASVTIDIALAIVVRQQLREEGRREPPGRFAVLGVGRLGAREMSYSPGVDLLYVYDSAPGAPDADRFFAAAARALTAALTTDTQDGPLYTVRAPAWPERGTGPDARPLAEYRARYARPGSIGDRIALTHVRAIGGDGELAGRLIACIEPFVYGGPGRESELRTEEGPGHVHEAVAPGGSIEVEQVTDAFRIRHGAAHPPLRHGSTLAALEIMSRAGLLDEGIRRELDHAYIFLRSAEHRDELGVREENTAQVAASRARVRDICRSLTR